jgi:hypothetical protein
MPNLPSHDAASSEDFPTHPSLERSGRQSFVTSLALASKHSQLLPVCPNHNQALNGIPGMVSLTLIGALHELS